MCRNCLYSAVIFNSKLDYSIHSGSQALHFSYGVGGFVSPLIARPFLRRKCVMVVNYTTIIDEWPYANSTSGIDNSTQIYHTQEEMHRDTHVRWAYWIVALLHVSINEFIGILANESNTPRCQKSLSFTSSKLTCARKHSP